MYHYDDRKLVKLGVSDPEFHLMTNFVHYQRASLEIAPDCPSGVVFMLQEAIANKWIALAAYMPEEQYMWEKLKNKDPK